MKKIVFLLAVCGLVMTSCMIPEKISYMKDIKPNVRYSIPQKPEMRIQPDDRLRIMVFSQKPVLSAPFNARVGGYQVSAEGEISMTGDAIIEEGYLVDREGNIEFPVLGMLRVEGLTLQELSDLIKDNLRKRTMLGDALVTVSFLNFKILLMGEVGGAGILSVPEGRITLLEAILQSGGLTNNASMKDVEVIREDENGRRMMKVDLRTMSMFNSSVFYLQQNDIVYVRPRVPQRTAREERGWQVFNLILGMTSTVTSIMLLFNFYNK